jgi:sugar phosphate isomerase/epimerase
LDFCHAIGAELYTFHPGFLSDPDGPGVSAGNYDFQWNDDLLEENALFRDAAFEWMLSGVEQVARRGADLGVKVAIETEGSFRRPHHLLMQRPEEYERFFQEFAANDVGINLNVGHLPLAAKAFGFSIAEFVDLVASRIVAMELSHNDKIDDQHLPLQSDGWYLELLDDPRLQNAYPILEFRNASISDILANIKMIQEKTYVV